MWWKYVKCFQWSIEGGNCSQTIKTKWTRLEQINTTYNAAQTLVKSYLRYVSVPVIHIYQIEHLIIYDLSFKIIKQ